MLFFENVSLAFSALKSNKTRALLTMLGIIIGIAAVITIMTVGNSMIASLTEELSSKGAKDITVGIQRKSDSGMNDLFASFGIFFGGDGPMRGLKEKDYITEERIEGILKAYGDRIEGIGFSETVGNGKTKIDSDYANVAVSGENKASIMDMDLELLAGRLFYDMDYDDGRKVAIVSDYFCNNLFGGDYEEAVGKQITVVVNGKYLTFKIIGVYKYSQRSFNFSDSEYDTRTQLYIPFNTAISFTHNKKGFKQVKVVATDINDAIDLADSIESFMNDKYYRNNDEYEISTFATQTQIKTMSSSVGMMSSAISVIAGISLLVGGIGVMNIMMVSITERTKEIGTRKALGATNLSIKTQFVIEAIVLCLVGGIIGVVLGLIVGSVATKYMGYPATASLKSIFGSLMFSVGIGVFFGYYPASKAAKMNPIDALRYE